MPLQGVVEGQKCALPVAELAGIALVVGLLVPIAAAGLVAQTIVIIRKAHWAKGFWNANGGIEWPLALLAGAFAVQVLGPGSWSLDAFLPLDVLYDPAASWIILGLAVAARCLPPSCRRRLRPRRRRADSSPSAAAVASA